MCLHAPENLTDFSRLEKRVEQMIQMVGSDKRPGSRTNAAFAQSLGNISDPSLFKEDPRRSLYRQDTARVDIELGTAESIRIIDQNGQKVVKFGTQMLWTIEMVKCFTVDGTENAKKLEKLKNMTRPELVKVAKTLEIPTTGAISQLVEQIIKACIHPVLPLHGAHGLSVSVFNRQK